MAELPSLVRVKRKRGDEPTADLFLEERTLKKQQVWQFRLQQVHPSHLPSESSIPEHHHHQHQQQDSLVRREFRLARPTRPLHRRIDPVRKRKIQPDSHDIPIFIEATPKRRRVDQDHVPLSVPGTPVSTPSNLKRPGASSRLKKPTAETLFQSPANPPPDRLADALHRFAIEEEAREVERAKPKVTSIPKKPVQRYRHRHPELFAAKALEAQSKVDQDVDMMSDDDDYVYDTYIRTKNPVVPANLESDDPANVQVGYIVIAEEDRPLWETYFEDELESDKEFETDEEDENAESYYAADYPEDEVASDDEHDRGAYGYRRGGSDDEQWESDPNDWSDGDQSMQNPWKKFPWMRSSQRLGDEKDDDDEL